MAIRSTRRFVGKANLKSGMLVEFSYTKLKDNQKNNYVALVIDPNKDNYMHALLIDDLTDFQLISLITKIGESFVYDPDKPDQPLTNLQTNESYNKYLSIKDQRRYRTFLVNNISNLRQILIGEVK